MVILAADTSSGLGSVAVRDSRGESCLVLMDGKKPHSETLLASVDEALALAGLSRGEVEALAVGTGPGIFTGLRVGLATFKGWALASNLPLIPVPSHGAAALFPLREGRGAIVLADARKGEAFASRYPGLDADGLPAQAGQTELVPLEEIPSWAAPFLDAEPVILGTAVPLVLEREAGNWPGRDLFMKGEPLAMGVLAMGEVLMSLGRSVSPPLLVPQYVRPPDARPPRPSGPAGGP